MSQVFTEPVLTKVLVEPNTAGSGSPNVLLAKESGTVLTNEGTTVINYHTLPTAAAGLQFTFVVQDSDGLRIVANTGDTIRFGDKVTAAAGYIQATLIGSYVTLVAINATEWVVTSSSGEWTDGTWGANSTHVDGSIYWKTPAATSNEAGVPIKAAGTTAAQGSASYVTQSASNRLTYTGTITRQLRVIGTFSLSAAATATTAKLHIYKNGSVVTGSTITRYISSADIGAVAIYATVNMAKDEYVELWCETNDGDDLTIQGGVFSLASID